MEPLVLDEDIDPKEAERVFQTLAQRIVRWNLATPAILWLESFRPLNVVGAHLYLFFHPLVHTLFPFPQGEIFARLMMERENVERFIQTILELDEEERKRNSGIEKGSMGHDRKEV